MLKLDVLKLQRHQCVDWFGVNGLRIARRVENPLEILQRNLGLAVNVDDVSQLLQRPKNIKGINQQREKLPNRNLLPENQKQHQEQNAGPQRIHDQIGRASC